MPRKIVIVAVGVVLAILALSFFATGYNLGGKPLVISEKVFFGYRAELDEDRFELHFDSTKREVTIMPKNQSLDGNSKILQTQPAKKGYSPSGLYTWSPGFPQRPPQESVVIEAIVTGESVTMRRTYKDSGDEDLWIEIPPEYLKWESVPGYHPQVERTVITQGEFYLLSILCLIGMCFLAMYAAFTSRRE